MSDDIEWKLTCDHAQQYASQIVALAARERRALLAQELEACAKVIVRQAAEIERLRQERTWAINSGITPTDIGMERVYGTWTDHDDGRQAFVFAEPGEDTRPLWRMPDDR